MPAFAALGGLPCSQAFVSHEKGSISVAMASSSQLYLLADHIKLSLLERQRAISLDLEPTSQDGHISRSLESMREGVEALEQEEYRLRVDGDLLVATPSRWME